MNRGRWEKEEEGYARQNIKECVLVELKNYKQGQLFC